MKLIRFFIMICGLTTTLGLCPMNNKPTEQKPEQKAQSAEQDFMLHTSAGKRATKDTLTNPLILMHIAHYRTGYPFKELSFYKTKPAFLVHLILENSNVPLYFAEDDEFTSMLNKDKQNTRKQENFKKTIHKLAQHSSSTSSTKSEGSTPQLKTSPYGAYTSRKLLTRPSSTPIDKNCPGRITPIVSPEVLIRSLQSINHCRRLASVSTSQLHELVLPEHIVAMKPLSEQTNEEKESLTTSISFAPTVHNNAILEEETNTHEEDEEARYASNLPDEDSAFFFPGDDEADQTKNDNLRTIVAGCLFKNTQSHHS